MILLNESVKAYFFKYESQTVGDKNKKKAIDQVVMSSKLFILKPFFNHTYLTEGCVLCC